MTKFLLYHCLRPFAYIWKLFWRPQFINIENIPEEGPVILCGNHTSPCDVALLYMSTKRTIRFLAKKELFDSKIKNLIFNSLAAIPVDRSKKDSNVLIKAEEMLNNGELLCIFPEGTINRTDDIVMPFKFGTVSLASKTNCKLVPFGITGKDPFIPFKEKPTIKFTKAYQLKDIDLEKENLKLMNEVKKILLGQN